MNDETRGSGAGRKITVGCLISLALGAALLWYVLDGLLGDTHHDSFADIDDARIESTIPPEARDITIVREIAGHSARYRVKPADFHRFLDEVWAARGKASAHRREEMSGEGEGVRSEEVDRLFGHRGWSPLEGARKYHGPSTDSGAITIYVLDPGAGIVYQDTGYW